jgi:hypothetical protein
MTYIISHRVNNLNKLKNTSEYFGVEIDIRTFKNKLILNHDPFLDGLNFETFIKIYDHSFLIINIKEEGIEKKIIQILNKFKIKKYFFLDSTVPMSLKLSSNINKCLRISDLERINFESKKINQFSWIWIDYINDIYAVKKIEFKILKKLKIKNCFVSPELININYSPVRLKNFLQKNKIIPDAICTKKPKYWEKIFKNS